MLRQRKVSVVIPAYNESAYIKDCLESLTQQTRAINEIIVVDNNSTDDTVKQINSLKLKNLTVLHERRQGVVLARKYGFDNATGDFILTLDSDSVADPLWAELMVKKMTEKNLDAVSCYVKTNEGSFKRLSMAVFNFFTFTINRLISGHGMLFGSTYGIRRTTWDEIREQLRERNDIWEDLDLALAIASQGGKIGTIRTKLVAISIRSGSMSLKQLYTRLMQWPRTYRPYDKVAALATIPVVYIALLGMIILKPLAGYAYKAK